MKEEYTTTRFVLGSADPRIPDRFYIVTGFNPFGHVVSDEENAQMNDVLRQQIEHEDWYFFEVTGRCEDHAEDGFGIECLHEEAILLGQEFQQDAIYEVRENQVFLVDCKEEEEDVLVGLWSELLLSSS